MSAGDESCSNSTHSCVCLQCGVYRCYLNMDISAGLFVEEINAVDLLREYLNARDAKGISDCES